MSKYIYPAVFTKEGDFYFVTFPDLESCYTQGENLQNALDMAKDVLCITLYDMEETAKLIPKPSDIQSFNLDKSSFVSLIDCDTLFYRKFYDNKSVKKTLTIPSWLNTIAERESVNFSGVLQKALIQELHIENRP